MKQEDDSDERRRGDGARRCPRRNLGLHCTLLLDPKTPCMGHPDLDRLIPPVPVFIGNNLSSELGPDTYFFCCGERAIYRRAARKP